MTKQIDRAYCRPMQPQDTDAVYQIETLIQTHPWSYQQIVQAQAEYVSTVLVLSKTEQAIGFCFFQPILDEANLLLIAIHPQYQGLGLGNQLLNASISALDECIHTVFLEVRETNLAAIQLYEKCGFNQIDRRKAYYPVRSGGREDAIIMACSLKLSL